MRHVSQELRRAKADLARENERERQRRKTKQRSRSAKVSAAQVMPERPSHRRQSRHAPVPHQRMKRLRPRRTEAKVATAPQVARNREGVLDTAEATDETGAEGWNIDPQKVKDTESQLPPGQSGTESIEAIELSVNDSGSTIKHLSYQNQSTMQQPKRTIRAPHYQSVDWKGRRAS